MARRIDVKIYCVKGKNRYLETFEEKEPDKWYGVAETPLPAISFFEKRAMQKKQDKKPGIFDIFVKPKSEPEPTLSISGTIYSGTHECPFCGNKGFVKCGACGEMTCMPDGAESFECAVCGNKGRITGSISDMSGDMNEGGGRKTNTLD